MVLVLSRKDIETYLVRVLHFTTSPQKSKDLQQGENDLPVAQQGSKRFDDLLREAESPLANLAEPMCASDKDGADLICNHRRQGVSHGLTGHLP